MRKGVSGAAQEKEEVDMSYKRHHAIVVTGQDCHITRAHKMTREMCQEVDLEPDSMVTPILVSPCNGYRSFMVGPDGSNEGWDRSKNGDLLRERLANWLNQECLDWIVVQYGDEMRDQKVVDCSDLRLEG